MINTKSEMLEALYTALPYVEDALFDAAFKPGRVAEHVKLIRAVIAKAEKEENKNENRTKTKSV
jgi:hypothetical protein